MEQSDRDRIIIRLGEEKRKKLLDEVTARDTTISALVRTSLDFFTAFEPAFMAQMERAAKISKLEIPAVIQNLLTFYLAKDQAEYNVYGPTRTYSSAFRFDEKGLVTGERLHDLVYAEEEKEAKDILRKLKRASADKKDLCIPRGEVQEISRAIAAKGRD